MKALLLAAALVLSIPLLAEAQGCGTGTLPACDPSSIMKWTAPTTNADGTPLTDLAGYDVLICTTSPCTRTTAGVIIRDVGKPTTTCTNAPNTHPAPCVFLGPLQIPTAGGKFFAVSAYDTSPARNASVPAAAPGPLTYSLTVQDNLAPAPASGVQVVQ